MIIEPEDDHATVQFVQPGRDRVSRRFRIEGRFEEREVVVLNSANVTVPGGHIQFTDTTLMPGRFTILIGETVFDVMPGGIDVDGRPFEWLHGESSE